MSGTGTAGTARKLPRARCLFVIAGAGLLAGGCSSQLESAQALLTAVQAPNLAEAVTILERSPGFVRFEDPFGFRWVLQDPGASFRSSGDIGGRWLDV